VVAGAEAGGTVGAPVVVVDDRDGTDDVVTVSSRAAVELEGAASPT
jgi:hypothetical protein